MVAAAEQATNDSLCIASAAEQATNDSWVDFNAHSYRYFSDGAVSGRQAALECSTHAAMLVSINTEAEFDYIVTDVLRGRTISAFIGGTDVEEGKWLVCVSECFCDDVTSQHVPIMYV